MGQNEQGRDIAVDPLVSVVIPTRGRPDYLPRAIRSALDGMPDGTVEVIVVVNGLDCASQTVSAAWQGDARVQFLSVATAHACVARNHGLVASRGRYIRFLDDDDVLYPEGACRQYETMERTNADVCSGFFEALDHEGKVFQVVDQPLTDDLVCALFSRNGMWQPTAHVYRRAAIQHLRWDESLPFCQDFDWLLRVVLAEERRWSRCDWVVGAWHRHLLPRISLAAGDEPRRRLLAERTLSALPLLEESQRMTPDRRAAVARLLWNGVHVGLCQRPWWWTAIARQAQRIAPGSHPDIALYQRSGWHPDPLLWEWLMLPKRWLEYRLRAWVRTTGWVNHG